MADGEPALHCVIAGGGPAGVVAGLLLARAGLRVTVLEKHDDFLRDFRGDTIHPSTLEVLQDLGLLEAFLRLPHQEIGELTGEVYGESVTLADFRFLPAPRPFLVLVPQWDFLDFIAGEARRLPHFTLHMGAKVAPCCVTSTPTTRPPSSSTRSTLAPVRSAKLGNSLALRAMKSRKSHCGTSTRKGRAAGRWRKSASVTTSP